MCSVLFERIGRSGYVSSVGHGKVPANLSKIQGKFALDDMATSGLAGRVSSHCPKVSALQFMVNQKGIGRPLSRLSNKLNTLEKSKKRIIVQLLDMMFAFLSIAVGNLLRLSTIDFGQLLPIFVIIPVVTVVIFSRLGVYNTVIRFSGIEELAPVVKGVIASSFLLLIIQHLLAPDPNPRSIFIIYGLVFFVFTAGARQLWKGFVSDATSAVGEPIAIYGAGALGRQVMQICRNGVEYRPVVWLDDDTKMHSRRLSNAVVLDPKDPATPALLKSYGIETILMAIPSVSAARMKQLLESLRNFDCRVQTLPSIDDIMANRVTTRDAKTLPLEELIGRQPVAPDMALMRKNITGKVVMVTGAGGSVGSELCR